MNFEPLVVGFLIFARLGGLLMTLPGISAAAVPPPARLAAALPLTFVLFPAAEGVVAPPTLGLLLGAVVVEALLGAAMGTVAALVYGSLTMAAEVIGLKMGLNIGGMLDPLSHAQQSSLGTLIGWLGTGIFCASNLHLRCIVALGDSLHALPPGAATHPARIGLVLIEVVNAVMVTALQLAGPIVVFVFIVNLAMLVLGRMAPNLQVFFAVGTSLTVVAGLGLLTAALPVLLGIYSRGLSAIPDGIAAVVRMAGGG
jgi:flagellar biosynthetic protein FliR